MTTKPAERPPRKANWILRLSMIGVFLFVTAGYLLPPNERALEKARRINCAGNLKQIVLAMELYAQDFAGEYPDRGLWQLADGNYLPAGKVYFCPTMLQHGKRESPTLADLKGWNVRLRLPGTLT
jgi:hypothetical protein